MPSVKPTLCELLGTVSKVSADWYTLGIQLDLAADDLDVIQANNPHNVEHCMKDMLQKWQRKYPQRGWDDVISSLRTMDRNDVAEDIVSKYCISTADSSVPGM